jgi:hypothetical protein
MWRRLKPGELDHEVVWLGVSLACAALAFAWVGFGLPGPPCVFHKVTGWPCLTCGSTRCVRLLLQGAFGGAFRMNPFFFTCLLGVAVFDVYAVVVLLGRLPRWRPERVPLWLRWILLAALLVNWAWLVVAGV